MKLWNNVLYYGDNLPILHDYIESDSVDLIYLDPPFNSNRSYNVLFKNETGKDSEAQLTAFEDTWQWDRAAEATYRDLVNDAPPQIVGMIGATRELIAWLLSSRSTLRVECRAIAALRRERDAERGTRGIAALTKFRT
ncbi:DNA methylase N-4/N-6 domain protein [Candidatus Moduliflexus flocculans]|uniref:DNA methylase N-4/N-6 domain protein n=1 Tax=Candidatus Moduliflexus flocculans TaxID=1499966 RepID=A0A0S6VTI6_9BACT|nr:DNA methylase N-4/N-6 domain protein [Candidatus Moduliflexus flocculans]